MNMRDETFINLKKALDDALAFERGKRRDLNVTRIQRRNRQSHNVHFRNDE